MRQSVLVRITAPHFCAAFDRSLPRLQFAPIIRWMQLKKWTNMQIRNYCTSKGWAYEEIR